MKKTFQEMAKEKGKTLLIESFTISPSSSKIEILTKLDSNVLVESSQGMQFKAIGIVREVPVTRFVENLNGRVYSRKLWEKVYKSKTAESTLCLADHPSDDSDGSVKDIVGVWRNFQVNENNCTADLYLVGKHGGLFLEVLQAGGKNGLSTVGFGELQEDEKTVNPDTYELIRLSDWVITPSQGVYAEQDNIDLESVKESKLKDNTKFNTNLMIENSKRNYNMVNESVQELTIRNNVKVALKESAKALEVKGSSLVDAKRELQDVLKYIPESYSEHRNTLIEEINKVDKAIKETISEKSVKLKESQKNAVDLNQKYKMSNVTVSKLKEQVNKTTKIAKRLIANEAVIKKENLAFAKDRKLMYKDIKALVEDRTVMKKDINILLRERSNMLADIKGLLEDKDNMIEDIKCFIEDRTAMYKYIKALKKENSKLKRKMREEEIGESEPGDLEPPEVLDQDLVQDKEYAGEKYDTIIDPAMAYKADDEDFGGVPFTNYNVEDGFLESKNRAKKKIKESSFSNSVVKKPVKNKDVAIYFSEKVKVKPILNQIKGKILSQTNLLEAVRIADSFLKTRKEKPIRISENVKVSHAMDWVGDNDY